MIKFSAEAKTAIDLILNSDQNVFVTGKAGTGKSTLLEHIRLVSENKLIVLAPTGISAVNVNGETIHSFFTLKPGFEKEEASHMTLNKKKQHQLQSVKTIAIDEISMVRADLLDAVDILLRRARGINKPFGGVRMAFFGDLYQLPPVVTSLDREKFFSEYKSPYFFEATVFRGQTEMFSTEFKLKVIELKKIYRQKDLAFIKLLNSVRDKTITAEQLDQLNERVQPNFIPRDKDKYIHLMTTNAAANEINEKKLRELDNEDKIFVANKSGNVARNLFPNDEVVTLKQGAQVMFICNDPERRWVNGTIGKIAEIRDTTNDETGAEERVVLVEKTDGKIVEVKNYTWEISKYVFVGGQFQREKLGTYEQIPIKLAWAITIHKSQGKTFDKAIVDLGRGTFAHGQTYVALSRCSSFEGLVLKKPITHNSIIMDPVVKGFSSIS
jgi:ATP-dependent exoDNAse (exonuclease V) alpha subunit